MNNFLSWNAYIFLGCVNNLLHIYCSLSNMQKENNYMFSLQVMLIQARFWALIFVIKSSWCNSEKEWWEEWSDNIPRTASGFRELSWISRKNILRPFCFLWIINYRVVVNWEVSCTVFALKSWPPLSQR